MSTFEPLGWEALTQAEANADELERQAAHAAKCPACGDPVYLCRCDEDDRDLSWEAKA